MFMNLMKNVKVQEMGYHNKLEKREIYIKT